MRNIQVGTINGDNNQFNQNNVNIKNINHNGGGNNRGGGNGKEDPGGEAASILFAIFFAVVVATFLYLKYYEPIFFWLKIGVVATGIVHATSFIPQWRNPNSGLGAMGHTFAGMLLAAAQAYVIITALNALPAEVLEIASRPMTAKGMLPQAMEVWNRFNNLGHRLITENMMTALLLTPAIALNMFYGIQHLLDTLADAEQSDVCAVVANWLRVFKSRGAPVAAFFTLGAYLVATGVLSPQPV